MNDLYGVMTDSKKTICTSDDLHLVGSLWGRKHGLRIVATHKKQGDIFEIYATGGIETTFQDVRLGTFANGMWIPDVQ